MEQSHVDEGAVTVEHVDRVAVVRLNRPEHLNAWNHEISSGLDAALRDCSEDPDVRSVVITGTGRAFCAGADLSGGADTFDSERDRDLEDTSEARTPKLLPHQVPKPVIAAINGPAVGVGATYPLMCDIRIAAQSARIGFVFNRIGMLPELGSHALLPRVVGFSNASQLLMGAETIVLRDIDRDLSQSREGEHCAKLRAWELQKTVRLYHLESRLVLLVGAPLLETTVPTIVNKMLLLK